MPAVAALLADAVFALHLAFMVWVMLGGLAVLRWPSLAWLHLPAVAWGATVELAGLWCPLTPLEQRLLQAAGDAGYEGGFISHYLIPIIYPAGLTRGVQIVLGIVVVTVNGLVYWRLLHKWRAQRGARRCGPVI